MNQKGKILLFGAGALLFLLMIVSLVLNASLRQQSTVANEENQPGVSETEEETFSLPDEAYPVPAEEAGAVQAEADRNFNIQALDRDLRYPWIDRLPVSSSTYYAYYDIAEESLIVILYAPDTPELRQSVEQRFREISVPYRDLPLRWERAE